MEAVQEREVQLQGRPAWPFHMMAAATSCLDNYSSSSSGGGDGGGDDCYVLGWEQQPLQPFGCFGVLAAAAAADVHELFPFFAGMDPPLPSVSSALALPPPPPPLPVHDKAAVPEELDDLLLNFWDASCCYDCDVGAQQQQVQVAFNPSCVAHEKGCSLAAATTNSLFPCDYGDDPLGSIFSAGPALAVAEAAVPQAPAEPLLSSSSSNCHADPHASEEASRAQPQATPSAARAPPLPRSSTSSSSLKRSTREEADQAECSQSGGKRRKEASPSPSPAAGIVCPFALLKPDGLNGGATLADINARILMRPSRPVRHPVGEFACAPRVSADAPGISGKAVSSFTRLHTPGRGTITIIRTRG